MVDKVTVPVSELELINKVNELIEDKQDVLTAGTDIEIVKGGSTPSVLPSGFQQLEYIEATGTQYIDTGFVPKTYGIEIEMVGKFNKLSTTTSPVCLWGFMGSKVSQPRWLVGQTIWTSNKSVWLMNLNITTPVPNITPDTNKHTFVTKAYTSGSSKYWSAELDGVVVQDNQTVSVAEEYEANTLSIYLFARNTEGTVGNFVQGRIYSFKIYDNDVLVRDFVPCIDTNKVACMYDMVGKQTYYNAGTGTFEAGEVVGDELIINFTNESGYALSSDLAVVATSGSYNDLTDKPTIPDVSSLANTDLSNLSVTGEAKFQAPLVSGTNIKTINNESILGSGNITISGGGGGTWGSITGTLSDQTDLKDALDLKLNISDVQEYTASEIETLWGSI